MFVAIIPLLAVASLLASPLTCNTIPNLTTRSLIQFLCESESYRFLCWQDYSHGAQYPVSRLDISI